MSIAASSEHGRGGPGAPGMETRPDDPAPPIAREGWIIVLIFFVLASGATALAWLAGPIAAACVGAVGVALSVWCIWFFRDPQRVIPCGPGVVVSAADGVVMRVEACAAPEELGMDPARAKAMQRVVVFLNVFDVHVNRAPIAGRLTRIVYVPGKFLNADLDKASEENERQYFVIEDASGMRVAFTQIAGLVARRIMKWVDVGQTLKVGERFGLIRFGSRVDVFLPAGYVPAVAVGQRAIAGETVLAVKGAPLMQGAQAQ